jgi:uncharacterized protein YwgA
MTVYKSLHNLLKVLVQIANKINLQIIVVETSKQRLPVSAIYCPPRYNIYANEFKTVLDKMNSSFIIEVTSMQSTPTGPQGY